jgi:hypothetical protein
LNARDRRIQATAQTSALPKRSKPGAQGLGSGLVDSSQSPYVPRSARLGGWEEGVERPTLARAGAAARHPDRAAAPPSAGARRRPPQGHCHRAAPFTRHAASPHPSTGRRLRFFCMPFFTHPPCGPRSPGSRGAP